MTPKILIIEDDSFLRNAYRNILGKEQFAINIAATGKEGLEYAEKWKPDLILLDLLMPEMDGVAFLKAFDAKNKPDTKIIVFSNLSLPEKVAEVTKLGAVNFKTKSMFTPKEMTRLIHDTLRGQPDRLAVS